MEKKIRVAMLGAGFMGQIHAKNMAKLPDVEVVAVCTATKEKADDFSSRFIEGKGAYDDFDKMLDEVEIDVLYVSLPPFAHNGQVEKAAGKGIHVFVEKPVAINTQRAESMVKAVREAGVKSQTGYHMRFGAAVKELKRLIGSGEAGMPTLFDARYECNSLHAPWWIDRNKSGGQIFEQVIHLYDMSMYLLGKPVNVSGFSANLCHRDVPGYTIEDTSISAIRFDTGALANISATNNAVPMEWNNPFTVVCKNLTAFFTNANKAEFVFTAGEKPERKVIDGNADMYFEEDLAFIAAVKGEAPNICTIEDGLSSLRVVESVMKSADSDGKSLSL